MKKIFLFLVAVIIVFSFGCSKSPKDLTDSQLIKGNIRSLNEFDFTYYEKTHGLLIDPEWLGGQCAIRYGSPDSSFYFQSVFRPDGVVINTIWIPKSDTTIILTYRYVYDGSMFKKNGIGERPEKLLVLRLSNKLGFVRQEEFSWNTTNLYNNNSRKYLELCFLELEEHRSDLEEINSGK